MNRAASRSPRDFTTKRLVFRPSPSGTLPGLSADFSTSPRGTQKTLRRLWSSVRFGHRRPKHERESRVSGGILAPSSNTVSLYGSSTKNATHSLCGRGDLSSENPRSTYAWPVLTSLPTGLNSTRQNRSRALSCSNKSRSVGYTRPPPTFWPNHAPNWRMPFGRVLSS